MRALVNLAKWAFILCLPILLVSASIGWVVNSRWLYKGGFENYDVSRATGLSEAELGKIASGLISYFNSRSESIDLTVVKQGKPQALFNAKEIAHLKDVKGLIRLDYWLLAGALIYTLGYILGNFLWGSHERWRRLAWGVAGGSGLTLILMLVLGLGMWLNFAQFFYRFHLLAFTNQLWQLDPASDYLIMLFPQAFFYRVGLYCVLATAVGAVTLGGLASSYLIFRRRDFLF